MTNGTSATSRRAALGRDGVLITSASRKVVLVRAFRRALQKRGSGKVVAVDVSPLAPALYEADAGYLVPRSDAPAFSDALLELCASEGIGLVVPTRDEELPVLAAAAGRFRESGTLVLVSSPEAIEMCSDKVRFIEAVRAAGLETPTAFADPASVRFPAFVKPRRGKGGRGTTTVTTPDELASALTAAGEGAVVQEFVAAPEYTIDVFIDLDGHPISCVPRERVAVIAGESVVSRTVRDPDMSGAAIWLCRAIGLVGHLTVQAFRTPDRIAFIEINPRYGGAANLGFEAGAPTPEYAIALAHGERVEPRLGAYEAGLVMLRHSDDRFIREDDLLIRGDVR
jgi:carbamoyl-phosphate synthase large subunit